MMHGNLHSLVETRLSGWAMYPLCSPSPPVTVCPPQLSHPPFRTETHPTWCLSPRGF